MAELKKILIVDDDPDIIEQLELVLKANGFDVIKAESAEKGEELVNESRPDAAVVDLMMEHMDSGFVLCNQMKRLYPDLPIVMLTAVRSSTRLDFDGKTSDAKTWIKADCMLDKPVRPEELLNSLKRLLPK